MSKVLDAQRWLAKLKSITALGWPSAADRFTNRPLARRFRRVRPAVRIVALTCAASVLPWPSLAHFNVHLDVEVSGVGKNHTILHPLEVRFVEHVDVAGCRDQISPISAALSMGITR